MLPDGGACLLGALNLAEFVEDGKFNLGQFTKAVRVATKALIDVQEEGIPFHPLKKQQETATIYRQIGLGIMGLADLFIKMGVKYGSPKSLEISDMIGKILINTAYEVSSEAPADAKLPSFDVKNSPFVQKNIEHYRNNPHNSQLLTIAPTGTISTMLNISGGIEPLFALEYERTTKSLHGKDVKYKVRPVIIQKWLDEHPEANNDIANLPDYFVSSGTITVDERINMQKVWQEHIDASISSTVNLPEKTTTAEVYDAYMKAWKAGLKGLTIFRDGCARTAILSTKENTTQEFPTSTAPKRPKVLPADFVKVKANGQGFFIFVGLMQNKPYEVFALPASDEDYSAVPSYTRGTITKVKKREYSFISDDKKLSLPNIALDEDNLEWRNTTLHVSAMLRHGMPILSIMKIEDKCNGIVTSFNKAVWKVLSRYAPEDSGEVCPDCGGAVIRENGCAHCTNCGWSKCMLILSEEYELD